MLRESSSGPLRESAKVSTCMILYIEICRACCPQNGQLSKPTILRYRDRIRSRSLSHLSRTSVNSPRLRVAFVALQVVGVLIVSIAGGVIACPSIPPRFPAPRSLHHAGPRGAERLERPREVLEVWKCSSLIARKVAAINFIIVLASQ